MLHRLSSLSRSTFTLSLAAAIVAASPGLFSYQAAAHVIVSPAKAGGRNVVATLPGFHAGQNHALAFQGRSLGLSGSLFTGSFGISLVPTAVPSAVTEAAIVGAPSFSLAARPRVATAKNVAAVASDVSKALAATGDVASASRGAAFGLGQDVQYLLTGERRPGVSDGVFAAAELGGKFRLEAEGPVYFFAKPAGEGIAKALRDGNGSVPPAGEDGLGQGPRKSGNPFWAKLLASGIALLPGVFLGWPLLAGAGLSGAFVIGASALLATVPFFSDRVPKLVRSLPGAALFTLGAVTTMVGVVAGGATLAAGILALLGGWGLIRFGRANEGDRSMENKETLGAFFGAVAAVASAGLVLLSPAGWFATALLWVSYPLSALLWFSLPAWLGAGLARAVMTVADGWSRVRRVMSGVRGDTVLRDRLDAFHERKMAKSGWNGVWLYTVVWPVVWLADDVPQFLLTTVLSAALALLEAPAMFLWGASHELSEKSRATVFFANWARTMYDNLQGSKARLYNPLAMSLIPSANSKSLALSIPAASGLRLLQYGWFVYNLLAAPFLLIGGLVNALRRFGEAYDPERHDPSSLGRHDKAKDGTGIPKPPLDEETPAPDDDSLSPKVIASLVALAPLLLLSYPVAGSLGALDVSLFALISLVTAAMPILRAKAPKWLRRMPGIVMTVIGVGIAFTGQGFWVGLLAAFAGWGLLRYSGREDSEKDRRKADVKYIGTFIGSVGVTTGMGVALLGLAGTFPIVLTVVAVLTSPFLLRHLPEWLFEGVGNFFAGFWVAAKGAFSVLRSWKKDTSFFKNLDRHYDYWMAKTRWHGVWLLSLIWVPLWLTQLVELAVSGAVGLFYGALLAPFNIGWGVARELDPKSAAARFFAGATRFMLDWTAGSKKQVFDKLNEPWLEPMNRSAEPSGRPTLNAVLALGVSRLTQLLWLAWLVQAAAPAIGAALWAFGAPALLVGLALANPMAWVLLVMAARAGLRAIKKGPDDSHDDPETLL